MPRSSAFLSCVALALTEGAVRLAHFDEAWPTARRAASLAKKVQCTIDPSFDVGAADVGRVRVTLIDGESLEAQHRTLAGLAFDGVMSPAKFEDCAGWLLDETQRRKIIDAFLDHRKCRRHVSVMALLAAPRLKTRSRRAQIPKHPSTRPSHYD